MPPIDTFLPGELAPGTGPTATGSDWWAVNRAPDRKSPSGTPGASDLTSWWNPQDPQGSWQRLVQNRPPSSQGLTDLAPYLQAIGGRLENPNAAGITSKIVLPGGEIVRVGNMFDAPGAAMSWGWVPQRAAGGGAPGGGGPGGWQEEGTADPWGSFRGAPKPFVAPTGLDYMNDPGFQARMKMGTDALQHAAAAKGALLSGGTLKALERYGQDYGSSEYGNVYNRALGGFMTNVGVRRGAQQDYWNRLRDLYGGGLEATGGTYRPPPG